MTPIQFQTIVGPDQIIRPPAGIDLPQGKIDVVVRPRNEEGSTNSVDLTRDWLLAFAEEAELAQPVLPSDLAANHDHYAHGKPRT